MADYNDRIIWPGWETVRLIGRGSFGAVYEIERDMLGEKEKAALKVITIPQSSSDIDELYGEGYDDESITSTFKAYLKSIVAEYSLMRKMNGSANVVNCDDVRYVQHDDGFGWDIFIKMELLTPLTKSLGKNTSDEQVARIGSDICKALILCKKHNIIHRDIKPANIFVSENGDYKLGDFGIAKTVEKTSGGTKIGTYEYMAPEVYHDQPYGSTVDIYSLGMVLYWLLNERRTPFLKMPPSLPTNSEKEQARKRRFGDETIPAPVHGSDELKRIVLKACAYDPKDRYQSAEEMLQDLESLGASSHIDTSILPNQSAEIILPAQDNEDDTTSSALNQFLKDEEEPVSALTIDGHQKNKAAIITETDRQNAEEDATVGVFDQAKLGGMDRDSDKTIGIFEKKTGSSPSPITPRQHRKLWLIGIASILVIVVSLIAFRSKDTSNSVVIGGTPSTTPVFISETATPSATPTEAPKVVPIYAEINYAKVGNIVRFGTYELDGNTANGKEDLEWIVLAIDNNQMLLTTRYAVANMQYNSVVYSMPDLNPYTQQTYYIDFTEACTWENSTLRKWLNEEFYTVAFDSLERSALIHVTNTNLEHDKYNDCDKYMRQEGPTTKDKVFVLSEDEVKLYFSDENVGVLLIPQALIDAGAQYSKSTGTMMWWTRTLNGNPGTSAMVVSVFGKVGTSSDVATYERGVRPTIIVDITKVK